MKMAPMMKTVLMMVMMYKLVLKLLMLMKMRMSIVMMMMMIKMIMIRMMMVMLMFNGDSGMLLVLAMMQKVIVMLTAGFKGCAFGAYDGNGGGQADDEDDIPTLMMSFVHHADASGDEHDGAAAG